MLQERRGPGASQQMDLREWIIRRKLVFSSARGFEKQIVGSGMKRENLVVGLDRNPRQI
jgi:hypothetical protein